MLIGNSSIHSETSRILILGVLAAPISLFLYSLAARSSNPMDFGQTMAFLSLVWTLNLLFDFGSNFTAVRGLSNGFLKLEEWYFQVSAKLTILVLSSTLGFLFLFALEKISWFYFIGYFLLSTAAQTLLVPVKAAGVTSAPSLIVLVEKFVALLWAVGALTFAGTFELEFALFLGSFFSFISSLLLFRRIVGKFRFNLDKWRNPWANSSINGLSSLIPTFQTADVAFLSIFTNLTQVGLYSAVNRWANILTLSSSAFSQALVPSASREAFKKSDIRDLWRAGRWLLLSIFAAMLAFIFTPWIISLVLTSRYSDSVPVLRVMLIATIATLFTQPLSAYLQSRGKEKHVLTSLTLGISVQVIVILMLAGSHGALAAAIALLIGQFISLTLLIFGIWSILTKS